MSGNQGRGLLALILGVSFMMAADSIGRHHAEQLKDLVRPYQLAVFFFGLLLALYGLFLMIFM